MTRRTAQDALRHCHLAEAAAGFASPPLVSHAPTASVSKPEKPLDRLSAEARDARPERAL